MSPVRNKIKSYPQDFQSLSPAYVLHLPQCSELNLQAELSSHASTGQLGTVLTQDTHRACQVQWNSPPLGAKVDLTAL